MLNPLTNDIVDNMMNEPTVVGLARTEEATVVGLARTEEATISALVKIDATVFLDVSCYSHKKQDAYDPRINTSDKTVVGAINQLLGYYNQQQEIITNLDNKKLDKVTTDGSEQAYIASGKNQITIKVSIPAEANTIVKRDANGNIYVGNPSEKMHATPKIYVDNAITQSSANTLKEANKYTDMKISENQGITYEAIREANYGRRY